MIEYLNLKNVPLWCPGSHHRNLQLSRYSIRSLSEIVLFKACGKSSKTANSQHLETFWSHESQQYCLNPHPANIFAKWHHSRSDLFTDSVVVFGCDVDGTCGQDDALLFWSAVAVLLQCLRISSHSVSLYPLSYCYWNSSQVSVHHMLLFSVCHHWRSSSGDIRSLRDLRW